MTLAGKVVLVLEDEPIIALALEDLLLDSEADPVFASTLDQAREALAQGGIDAAVLDINVHGEQSYPIAAELRAGGIPFIFATGYGATTHPPEFARAPTIAKPYNVADLIKALGVAERA